MQAKCNYSAVLSEGLFSLDEYSVRNVWTLLFCRVCWFSVSSGWAHAPVKTAIWKVFSHLATYHQLIHTVPCRFFLIPFTLLHTQANRDLHLYATHKQINWHLMWFKGHLWVKNIQYVIYCITKLLDGLLNSKWAVGITWFSRPGLFLTYSYQWCS